MVYVVLVWFGTRLCLWKYDTSLVRSSCALCFSMSSVGAVMMRVVSSAYVYIFECLVDVVISLM